MILKRLSYIIIATVLLSSCKQFKALTAQDNSSTQKSTNQRKSKEVKFLDDISVTPGQVVTTRQTTTGPSAPKGFTKKSPGNTFDIPMPAGDIERADWLQLKYAIMLDANVEKLSNINLLKLIDDWYGTRYCMGGSSKSCIDCSAFTQVLMYSIYNINLPRTAQDQYNNAQAIGMEDLNEGDLVFFNTGGRSISHVGIYLLNNKFVHAATTGGVMVSDLNDGYWRSRFKGAGRVKAAS